MNTRGSCSDNCAAFQVAEPLGCYKDMFCAKQSRCQGTNFNLDFFSNNHRLIKCLFSVIKVVFLNVNFSMPMLGSACLKTDKGNTTGSNMKMGLNLESKNNALVSISSYLSFNAFNKNLTKIHSFFKRCFTRSLVDTLWG